jgi:hypothetical protein
VLNQIRRRAQLLLCLTMCYTLFSSVVAQENKSSDKVLHFYTEIARPYFWFDENNQPQGATYYLALELMTHANIKAVVEHLPWARAYVETVSKPDIVLLTALRTTAKGKTVTVVRDSAYRSGTSASTEK